MVASNEFKCTWLSLCPVVSVCAFAQLCQIVPWWPYLCLVVTGPSCVSLCLGSVVSDCILNTFVCLVVPSCDKSFPVVPGGGQFCPSLLVCSRYWWVFLFKLSFFCLFKKENIWNSWHFCIISDKSIWLAQTHAKIAIWRVAQQQKICFHYCPFVDDHDKAIYLLV